MSSGRRVAVVGGGITGLAAAWELQDCGVDAHLFEAAPRVGGVIETWAHEGYHFERGPNSVQGGRDDFMTFCREAGLEKDIVPSSDVARERFLYFHGRLQSLPRGLREFLFDCDLFTPLQKARVLLEPFIPTAPPDHEPTVAEWMGRRLGRGVTMTWVDVMVSGVYAGNPNRLGVRSAFPQLWEMEQEHGSVFNAMRHRLRARRARIARGEEPARMLSFRGGMETLPRTLGERLGDRVHLRRRVEAIEKDGKGFRVAVTGPGAQETFECDRVVLAAPAARAGMLLSPLAPDVADLMFDIESVSLATIQAGFEADQLGDLPKGFGYLVPRCARLRSLGWIFLSHVFADAAPEGKIALSGFLGGTLDPHAVDSSDAQIRHLVLGELALALRLQKLPRPDVFSVTRWRETIPQYNVGHGKRVDAIRELLHLHVPGLHLAGSWADGVAVDRCVAGGRAAAQRAVESLAAPVTTP